MTYFKLVKEDGWHLIAQKDSHRQFKHPAKPGRVTVAGHLNKELHPEILNSILKQAGLKERKRK